MNGLVKIKLCLSNASDDGIFSKSFDEVFSWNINIAVSYVMIFINWFAYIFRISRILNMVFGLTITLPIR